GRRRSQGFRTSSNVDRVPRVHRMSFDSPTVTQLKESFRAMAGPAFRAAAVRVRVPATSANLGPGFDAFGLALGLYDDVVVRVADSGLHIDIAGEGEETLPRDERHLL